MAQDSSSQSLASKINLEALSLLGLGALCYAGIKLWMQAPMAPEGQEAPLNWQMGVPFAFVLAAVYALFARIPAIPLPFQKRFQLQWLLEIGLSLSAVLYVHYMDPIIYVDDAGFILRYLDHFAQGCFYCFNVEDGPVFGISSFVYGLLAGLLTWTHLLDAEGALNYLSYLGIFFTGWLFFRILRQTIQAEGALLLLWLLLMTCSRSAAIIYNSGMEAPVHFSLVLAALLFYLLRRDRWMWLFLAIAVISKLDAVPFVLVIISFWTIENWADLGQFDWYKKRYHEALKFGLLPILIWIGFAILVFGSPLPQSAYAKVFYHNHADGSWFPFLEGLMHETYQGFFLAIALLLFSAQIGYVAAKRQGGRQLVFGFAFLATLLLYYFYNPGERMLWYYVLPEGLMLLQLASSLQWLNAFLPSKRFFPGPIIGLSLCLAGLWLGTGQPRQNDIAYHHNYKTTVEIERMRIGAYLHNRVPATDTVLSGHGLIGRPVKGYVIDQTGLNSRVVTALGYQDTTLWKTLKPDWIVMHGYSWVIGQLNAHPYVLDTSYFDICTYGYPAWRVFRRVPEMQQSAGTYFLQPTEILGKDMEITQEEQKFWRYKAEAFTVVRQAFNPYDWKLTFGMLRHPYDYTLHVRDVVNGDSLIWEQTYTIRCYAGAGNPRICPITVSLRRDNWTGALPTGPRYISLEFRDSYGKVAMYDPAVSISR